MHFKKYIDSDAADIVIISRGLHRIAYLSGRERGREGEVEERKEWREGERNDGGGC